MNCTVVFNKDLDVSKINPLQLVALGMEYGSVKPGEKVQKAVQIDLIQSEKGWVLDTRK